MTNTEAVPADLSFALRARRRGNWINGSTPAGLLLARLGRARVRRGPWGLYLAENYRWSFPRAGAFTVGNVVLSTSRLDDLARLQPDVLAHENEHAWQYFWFLGIPFLPLYLASAAWSWLRTGDPASANPFERHAGLSGGGYQERPRDNAGLRQLRARSTGLVRGRLRPRMERRQR